MSARTIAAKVLTSIGAVLLALVAWTAYTNVVADDAAVRAKAESLARETAGCGAECKLASLEGSRGIIHEEITFRFKDAGTVIVKCRRAYIAFGAHECRARR